MCELDLGTGSIQALKEFHIKANDSMLWIPISVGFARRHTKKEFAFSDEGIKRDDFLKQLKNDVLCVRDMKVNNGVPTMRVTLRSLASFESVMYTLFAGPIDHRLHFVSQVNSEDILRLQDRAITNKR